MSEIHDAQYNLVFENTILLNLDPKLQSAVMEKRDRGIVGFALLTHLSVVARIKRAPVNHLAISSSVVDPLSGDLIVAADIDTDFIEDVRKNVVSLKFADPLREAFDTKAVNSTPAALSAAVHGTAAPTGKGIIIGIVDGGGLDAVHSNFRRADGTTRILAVWDQNESGPSPSPYNYGREHTESEINAGLAKCLNGLEVCPSYRVTTVNPQSHATYVADVAAGNGGVPPGGTGVPGIAPDADIVFVNLQYETTTQTVAGRWRHVIDGVHYVFEKARQTGRQAVVNLSLQSLGGPHDDRSLIARALNGLVAVPGRAIVVAEAETRRFGQHAEDVVPAASPFTLGIDLRQSGSTTADIEIWYDGASALSVLLTSDTGQTLGPVALNSTATLEANGIVVGRIHHRFHDPNNGDNVIEILFGPNVIGVWKATMRSVNGNSVPFQAWLTDSDAVFTSGVQMSRTINGLDASGTISVGAFSSAQPVRAADFSGEGPDRLGAQKPDLLAPGLGVITASASGNRSLPHDGTSFAAPHVTGIVALMMEAAGRHLTAAEIRTALTSRASDGGGVWNPRTGYGVVDGAAAVAVVAPVQVPIIA